MDEVLKTNDWITCPYDPNHTMKYSKFHNHFVKCKAAHPNDPREQCPYYASELIHPDKMKDHLLTCKYKTLYPNLYYDTSALPKYDAPCHFNLEEESGNESDDDAKTVITLDRDDKSSLFSAATRSFKANSSNYNDTKPHVRSYAFEYIDDNEVNSSVVEVLGNGNDDSGNYSWESMNGNSFSSHQSTPRERDRESGEENSPSGGTREIDSPVRRFENKVGLGRGKVIQRLLSSSTSSLDSFEGPRKGSGRGDWFRRRNAEASINNYF